MSYQQNTVNVKSTLHTLFCYTNNFVQLWKRRYKKPKAYHTISPTIHK